MFLSNSVHTNPIIAQIRLNLSRIKTILTWIVTGQLRKHYIDRFNPWLVRRFARHNRFNPQNFAPADGYRIEAVGFLFIGRISILRAKQFGRFGNAIYQLLNVVLIARYIGVTRVQIFPFVGGPPPGTYVLDGISIEIGEFEPAVVPTLTGEFWNNDQFPEALVSYAADAPLRAIDRVVKPLLAHLQAFAPEADPQSVVLHFRSGDIFTGRLLFPWYLQPPAAYYVMAALHARATYGVTRAILVYQDTANPCIAAAEDALIAAGMQVTRQSSSLMADIGTLFGATHLVSSFSTLCEALAMGSTTLRSCYAFRQFESQRHLYMQRPSWVMQAMRAHGVAMWRIQDSARDFIHPLSWDRSEAQHRTLVEFPITSLSLDTPADDADDAVFAEYHQINWKENVYREF